MIVKKLSKINQKLYQVAVENREQATLLVKHDPEMDLFNKKLNESGFYYSFGL